jgi:hypothetical protein
VNTKTSEQVVFVVDIQHLDIDCGRLVTDGPAQKTVKFKHRSRAAAVPSLLCHDTLDAAKAALIKYIQSRVKNVEQLEYDAENFWVA